MCIRDRVGVGQRGGGGRHLRHVSGDELVALLLQRLADGGEVLRAGGDLSGILTGVEIVRTGIQSVHHQLVGVFVLQIDDDNALLGEHEADTAHLAEVAAEDVYKRQLHGREEKVNPKLTAYQVELAQVEAEIEKLLDTLTGANATLLAYANKKIEELYTRRQTILKAIAELSVETISPQQIKKLSYYLDNWDSIDSVSYTHLAYQVFLQESLWAR